MTDEKEYTIADLQAIRQQQKSILRTELDNTGALGELACANTLLCEKYMVLSSWLNAELVEEIVHCVSRIMEHEGRLDIVENICVRAADTLHHHPRLKLKLLLLQRDAVIEQGGSRAEAAEMGIDELSAEIMLLQNNIMAADLLQWDNITQTKFLKQDPIEWTEEFERVIAKAEEKADARLKDTPRGMGFCFAWWHELADILHSEYGIDWKSPQQMNPNVHFD